MANAMGPQNKVPLAMTLSDSLQPAHSYPESKHSGLGDQNKSEPLRAQDKSKPLSQSGLLQAGPGSFTAQSTGHSRISSVADDLQSPKSVKDGYGHTYNPYKVVLTICFCHDAVRVGFMENLLVKFCVCMAHHVCIFELVLQKPFWLWDQRGFELMKCRSD
jgi:hypothetical protein